MNVSTIKGIVQSHTKKPFDTSDGKTMIDNSLVVNTSSGNVTVKKYTMSTTSFDIPIGTEVQVSFDAQEKTGSKGKYTVNKIIDKGLTILTGGAKNDSHIAVTSGTSSPTLSAPKASYDSNGARNGMIAGKAVELAIARGETSLDALKTAASDVLALTFFVESGAKVETKIKEPMKSVKKAVKKEEIVEEDDFEFDE